MPGVNRSLISVIWAKSRLRSKKIPLGYSGACGDVFGVGEVPGVMLWQSAGQRFVKPRFVRAEDLVKMGEPSGVERG